MAKKKTKRDVRREQRDQRVEDEAAAQVAFEAKRKKYRIAALAIPLITLGAAIGVYMATEDKQLGGLAGLVGIGAWILVLLGLIGSSIKPRDRVRAGSIDFGNKR